MEGGPRHIRSVERVEVGELLESGGFRLRVG